MEPPTVRHSTLCAYRMGGRFAPKASRRCALPTRHTGGPGKSLQRAIAHLNTLNLQDASPPIFARELDRKACKLGSRGISIVRRLDPRRPNVEQYVFHVIMHGVKRANVYIGTKATWQANYAAKLQEARELRFNSFRDALGEAEAQRILMQEGGMDQCAPLQEANCAPRRRSTRP